jgi:hypothetical protein
MAYLILALWLLLPAVAHANEVVGGVVAIAGLVIGGPIGAILLAVGSSVYGTAQQRRAEQAAKDAYNAGLKDRTITAVATDMPYRYVYGRARVGSAVVAMFTSGDKDQYKHLVCVHAAHECDAFEEIYIAGKALGPLDSSGNVTSGDYYYTTTEYYSARLFSTSTVFPYEGISGVRVTTNQWAGDGNSEVPFSFDAATKTLTISRDPSADVIYASFYCKVGHSRVNVQKHLGTPGQAVDAYLHGIVGTSVWPNTSTLTGFTYTVVTLDLNQPEFQGGIPTIEVLLRGKKLYDPRSGTRYWSYNPALVIYDYLTSEMCGVDAADIPLADVITAANVCDTLTAGASVSGSDNRYTINGSVSSDDDQAQVLERMAQAMAGGIVSTNWRMWAGNYTAPVMALDQSDIVGEISITPGLSDADVYNGIKGRYIGPVNGYVETDFTPYQNSVYVSADGGKEKWSNIDFHFTDDPQRIHNLCRIFTEDQRNGFTFKGVFSLKAWSLQIGDRVTLTSPVFGFAAKVFRVTDKQYSPGSGASLTLKEDAAEIWDLADAVVVDATPNTNLPNPFFVRPLASLTCTSGTNELLLQADGTIVSRIRAAFPASTDQAANHGVIDVEWIVAGGTVWNRMQVSGDASDAYLSPVIDRAPYTVRARLRNPSLNVSSDWVYTNHTVIGKTEPPPNIIDLTISGTVLSWTPVQALDLAGYVFRFHYGSNFDWGSAAPLHSGLITQNPFDLVTRPGGVVTIMGKAVDTTGNESRASSNIVTDLGDPYIANVVEVIDLQAQSFPGTVTGGGLVDGALLADATDSAYGTDNQSFFGQDNDPAYDLSSYAQMVYTSSEILIASALAGSVATLDIASQGADLTIEYRFAGPSSAYGPDGDSAYGADAEPFFDAPGSWIPWPGQIVVRNDAYQFRVTLGAGATHGHISALSLTIDAPDMVEDLSDLTISSAGTAIPYTSDFTAITNIQATLQAGASGAVSLEIDKTNPLTPVVKAYNASHVAVSGATADIRLKGY